MSDTGLWRTTIPRMLAGAVGLIFLAAALFKAADMGLFVRQIKDYGIISHPVATTLSAWVVISMECAVGVALLVAYRPRFILPFTTTLLVVFIGVTGWAWSTGATEDCGCFGPWVSRTPGEALVEDLILLAVTGLAWAGHRRLPTMGSRKKAWTVLAAGLIGLALPAVFGFPVTGTPPSRANTGGEALDRFDIEGIPSVDLSQGSHLIIVMDTGCLHCQEMIPQLNLLADTADLPPVIALCTNGESERTTFVQAFQPVFPIGQIQDHVFWKLLGDGELPRILLVDHGHVTKTWDETVPDTDTIRTAGRF